MFNYIVREKCAVTDEAGFEPLFSYDFPLFCGCTNLPQSEDIIAKMDFVIANPSGVVQLKNLIPLDLLYQNGHDSGAVGALWSSHHAEFADFVMSFSPKNVLEIGGGHSKLALNCLAKNPNLNYTIIEPNPTKHERINYIEKFFGETTLPQKYDCIVHSHLFEHIYNPNEFLGKIYENLCDDLCGGAQTRESKARLIFSLPNMQKWLSNKFTNTLNYEHSIFLNEPVIKYLLHKNGFKVLQKRYFKEHSIFFACEKVINRACVSESQITLKSQYAQNKAMIGEFLDFYRRKILDLNAILESTTKPVYLFGAHLFSQFLLYNGLQSAKIISILDNNKAKQGKRLYGTRFLVQSPQILRNKNALLILNAGAYTDEIKSDILENINARTEIVG